MDMRNLRDKAIHAISKPASCSEICRTAKRFFYVLAKRKTCIYAVLNKFNYQNRQMKTTTCLLRLLLISIVSLSLPSLYPADHKEEKYVCLRTLQGHTDEVNSVTFSPDGKTLVSASDDKSVKVWDTNTWECLRTLQGHTFSVLSVAFAPDGKILASASDNYSVQVWDTTKGTCLRTLTGHKWGVNSVAFSPDGTTLASASYKEVKVWDTSTWECLRTLRGHTDEVNGVTFAPNGKTLASASYKEVLVWDTSTWECCRTLKGHTLDINSVAFSPDGKTIASASGELDEAGEIKIWDAAHGTCLRTLQGHESSVNSVAFAQDSKGSDLLISGYCKKYGDKLSIPNVIANLISTYVLHQGRTLASASADKTLKVWDTNTDQCLDTLQGHTDWVWSVCYAPGGQILASASSDKTIKIWGIKH